MQDHAFYLALAYGLSGLGLLAEVLCLWRRCRRSAASAERAMNPGDAA